MKFHLIDTDKWDRKEYFHHYFDDVTCTYSLTVNIDITGLHGHKIYPAMLWLLTRTVNDMVEFRTTLRPEGLGYFEEMHPSYTIFNKDNKNFSDIWTEFNSNYTLFLDQYNTDLTRYSSSKVFQPKDHRPVNTFDVSMLPWLTFTSFNLNIYGSGKYLLPIFTMGKTFTQSSQVFMPLAIQVHHAVSDGYHVGMFVQRLQESIENFSHINESQR
jgi:chloramphenicol O-acetyltransferase type A